MVTRDKAVYPKSIMGATKRIAELVTSECATGSRGWIIRLETPGITRPALSKLIMEPSPALGLPAFGEGKFGACFDFGIHPRGSVAEAFTDVVFQVAMFSGLSRFTQLSARVASQFSGDDGCESGSALISQTRPDKVKDLMNQNQFQLRRTSEQLRF